jgi:hypothetical protein
VEYVTKGGIRLEVGRIPRQEIDRFIAARPPPEPPTKAVTVFGDVEEDVPVLDDAEYLAALSNYYIELGCDKAALIVEAVEVLGDVDFAADLEELRSAGLVQGDGRVDLLRYVVLGNTSDLEQVVALVFYNSTVTVQGIQEAAQAFNLMWNGQPVSPFLLSKGNALAASAFNDRLAARWANYNWEEFSALSGPEQSATVAFYRLNMRLSQINRT